MTTPLYPMLQPSDLEPIIESPVSSPEAPERPLPSPPSLAPVVIVSPVSPGGSLPPPLRTRKPIARQLDLGKEEEEESISTDREEQSGDSSESGKGLSPATRRAGIMTWFTSSPSAAMEGHEVRRSSSDSPIPPRVRTLSGSSTPPQQLSAKSSPATLNTSLPPETAIPPLTDEPDGGPSFSKPVPNSASAALTLLRQYSPAVATFVEQQKDAMLKASEIKRTGTPPAGTTSDRAGLVGRARFLSSPSLVPFNAVIAGNGQNIPADGNPPHEERIRVSGTFGVRDEVAVDSQRIREGESLDEATEAMRPGTPIPSDDIIQTRSHSTPKVDTQSLEPEESIEVPQRRNSLIVGNIRGVTSARESGPIPASSPEQLRDIFPGSEDWKTTESPTTGQTVFTLGQGPALLPVQFPRLSSSGAGLGLRGVPPVRRASTAPGRLASLTESEIEEQHLAQLRNAAEQGEATRRQTVEGVSTSIDGEGTHPHGEARPSWDGWSFNNRRSKATSSLSGAREFRLVSEGFTDKPRRDNAALDPPERATNIPLLMASSILSKHASQLLENSTEQKRRSLQLRMMAKESLEAGRMLLELAEEEESDPSPVDEDVGDREERNRQAAFDSLVGGLPRLQTGLPSGAVNSTRYSSASIPSPGLPIEVVRKAEKLGQDAFGKMREAEASWEEMIKVLKEGADRRGRRPSKLQKRNSPSPLAPASSSGIIKRPGEDRPRSRSASPTKQQVRFERPEKTKRRWFGFGGRKRVIVAPGQE